MQQHVGKRNGEGNGPGRAVQHAGVAMPAFTPECYLRNLVVVSVVPEYLHGADFRARSAAGAFFLIADDLVVLHAQRVHGEALTSLDAGLAAHAAAGVVLGHGHADDPEVVEAHFTAVVGTSGQRGLEMQVVGEDLIFDPFCELGRIVVGKGTDIVADAGGNVSCAGRGA